jgi:hypothetical protein
MQSNQLAGNGNSPQEPNTEQGVVADADVCSTDAGCDAAHAAVQVMLPAGPGSVTYAYGDKHASSHFEGSLPVSEAPAGCSASGGAGSVDCTLQLLDKQLALDDNAAHIVEAAPSAPRAVTASLDGSTTACSAAPHATQLPAYCRLYELD